MSDCERACAGGDIAGCFQAGFLHESRGNTERELAQAAALYEKACRAGHGEACLRLGNMYERGNGVTEDRARAAELRERGMAILREACERGEAERCLEAGSHYEYDFGLRAEEAQAAHWYSRACDQGAAAGCRSWASYYESAGNLPQAAVLRRRACVGGDSRGCYELGRMTEGGAGVARDVQAAAALYERACEGGIGEGCHALGTLYEFGRGVPRDFDRADAWYRRGYVAGYTPGRSGPPRADRFRPYALAFWAAMAAGGVALIALWRRRSRRQADRPTRLPSALPHWLTVGGWILLGAQPLAFIAILGSLFALSGHVPSVGEPLFYLAWHLGFGGAFAALPWTLAAVIALARSGRERPPLSARECALLLLAGIEGALVAVVTALSFIR